MFVNLYLWPINATRSCFEYQIYEDEISGELLPPTRGTHTRWPLVYRYVDHLHQLSSMWSGQRPKSDISTKNESHQTKIYVVSLLYLDDASLFLSEIWISLKMLFKWHKHTLGCFFILASSPLGMDSLLSAVNDSLAWFIWISIFFFHRSALCFAFSDVINHKWAAAENAL